MLDRFVYGAVERISPEAPVPVFRIQRESQSLGGAGNVVRNLANLGVKVTVASVIGEDECGNIIESTIHSLDTVHAYLVREGGRISTLKTRYIAAGQQLMRADQEQTTFIESATIEALQHFITHHISQVSLVILSDYGKGVLHPELISWVISTAKQHGKKVIVDPKGNDYAVYRGCDLITPNTKELALASRLATNTDEQVVAAALSLQDEYGLQAVLATRGEKGMSLILSKDQVMHIPTRALEVFDVSGAGDTVIAVVGACLAQNAAFHTAAALANIAAGLVVAKIGTASLSSCELLEALETRIMPVTHDKIVSCWEEGVQKVLEWHRKGLRVGFTNGCFDLFHPGHLSLLRQAKQNCDRLIVGLNSDASVQRLKGSGRPIYTQDNRAAILAALHDVDLILFFDEDTPLKLIQTVRPDVLIKGADYTHQQIVGAREVFSWGGEVILAHLEPGFSTTRLIERLSLSERAA